MLDAQKRLRILFGSGNSGSIADVEGAGWKARSRSIWAGVRATAYFHPFYTHGLGSVMPGGLACRMRAVRSGWYRLDWRGQNQAFPAGKAGNSKRAAAWQRCDQIIIAVHIAIAD